MRGDKLGELFLIIGNLVVTGYWLVSFIFNLMLIDSITKVAFNPLIPKLPPLLEGSFLKFVYWHKYIIPDDVAMMPYLDQMSWFVMEKIDRALVERNIRICTILLILGWFGKYFKRFLSPAVDSDFAHLSSVGGTQDRGWKGYARFMLVLTRSAFSFMVTPHILDNSKHSSSFLVPYMFAVTSLNSFCQLPETIYYMYTSADAFFIPRTLIHTKGFCDLFLRSFASSQEAVVTLMALFTPLPAYHYVTATKLMASAALLFYYIPSPFLLFNDGWEQRKELYEKWGVMSSKRVREIEEIMVRADPAFKRFEKKKRKERIERDRAARRISGVEGGRIKEE